jgi:class 3 adenylate cyclase
MQSIVKLTILGIAKLAKQNQELEELLKKLQRKNEKLIRENENAKAILEKVSPDKLDKELSAEQKPRSLKFEMATVLFADIHGFSKISDKVDSEALMDELDEIIFAFNSIVKKYNIEKIKTIGDTYMSAGGILLMLLWLLWKCKVLLKPLVKTGRENPVSSGN